MLRTSSLFLQRHTRVLRLPRHATALFSTSTPTVVEKDGVFEKIACIGTGKMAQAIIEPMIKKGVQPADRFAIYDVSDKLMAKLKDDLGVQTSTSIPGAVNGADLVICAVKPQNLDASFFAEMRKGKPEPDSILMSVIAGKSMETFYDCGFEKIVRSMPNTPAMIGQGMTVWSGTPNITSDERRKIRQIMSSFGKSLYFDAEKFIDISTSISGSGPAYIFMLMEAMVE